MSAELLTEYKNTSGKLNLKSNMKSKWAPFTLIQVSGLILHNSLARLIAKYIVLGCWSGCAAFLAIASSEHKHLVSVNFKIKIIHVNIVILRDFEGEFDIQTSWFWSSCLLLRSTNFQMNSIFFFFFLIWISHIHILIITLLVIWFIFHCLPAASIKATWKLIAAHITKKNCRAAFNFIDFI